MWSSAPEQSGVFGLHLEQIEQPHPLRIDVVNVGLDGFVGFCGCGHRSVPGLLNVDVYAGGGCHAGNLRNYRLVTAWRSVRDLDRDLVYARLSGCQDGTDHLCRNIADQNRRRIGERIEGI